MLNTAKRAISKMELILLGTGTSSAIPVLSCLTAGYAGGLVTCKVCASTLIPLPSTEPGKALKFSKNRRRNTGALLRYSHSDGTTKNILIDCGKTFYEASMTWFVEYGIRQIDAVLLTHGHADAVFGFDDLRTFTASKIQDRVDIFLDKPTMDVVQQAFPYMVDSSKATGSGEVGRYNFTIIDPLKPLVLFDELTVLPFEGTLLLIQSSMVCTQIGRRISRLVSGLEVFPTSQTSLIYQRERRRSFKVRSIW